MEVGYDLGYQNLSKFSEMFKKVKGIPPSEVI
jgi:YesN/AraC family two-component response regulator